MPTTFFLDYKVAPANARNGLDRLEELACLNEGPEWYKGVTFSQTQETAGTSHGTYVGLNWGSPGGLGAPPNLEAKSNTSVSVPVDINSKMGDDPSIRW